MTTPAHFFRFVLLKTVPNDLLSYDRQASIEALFETTESYLQAIYNLLALLQEFKTTSPRPLPAAAIATMWLLEDIQMQLQKFDPSLCP